MYTGGLAVEVVGWAKGLATPPQLMHVDMRIAERGGMVWEKRLGHSPIFWAIMATHTVDKPKPGLCAIYPTTNLVPLPQADGHDCHQ